MLNIKSKYPSRQYIYGGSIFSIASNILRKTANSGIAKKIINSSATQGLKKVATSEIGKQLQSHVLNGVQNASQNALETAYSKIGLAPLKKRKRKNKNTAVKTKKIRGSGIVLD